MKPFLHGRSSVDSEALSSPRHGGLAISGVMHPAQVGARIEVIKQGDKVVRMIVICSCGERTEVECVYPVGS